MNTELANKCGLKREDFQTTVNGKKTDLFVLRNKQGNEVAVTNYGGAVVAIMMPDKDGNYANLIQGHDNIQDVINSPEPFLSVHTTDADMNFELKGNYQKKNFCTISAAVECLKEEGIEIKDESIKNGFEHVCELTGLRGRWEKLMFVITDRIGVMMLVLSSLPPNPTSMTAKSTFCSAKY